MRKILSILFTSALFASAASAQPVVRDHRVGAPNAYPTEAPPAPRVEKFAPRRGQVWVAGQYEWRGGKWTWKAGHFEARKKGKRYNGGRWEKKGDRYEWAAGTWSDAPKDPDPPPALLEEKSLPPRRGFAWVKGYWEWNDGSYDWVPGKLQARQRGKTWVDGHWDNAGGRWTWTAGAWANAPKDPPAPPSPIAETPQRRSGMVWVAGHWEWSDGSYEWVAGKLERRQRGKRWREGKWDNNGGRWQWSAGSWFDAPKEQDAPPPSIDEPAQAARKGFVWVKGHHEYRDGDYEWIAGHWERERANKRWADGHWDQAGGKWVYTPGAWQ